MNFKEKVEEILKKQNLRKADLARMLEIKPQTLNSFLKSNNPTQETVQKVADALKVKFEEFYLHTETNEDKKEIETLKRENELMREALNAYRKLYKSEEDLKETKNIEVVPK